MAFFFSSRRRHTRCLSDWSSDVCSSDLKQLGQANPALGGRELIVADLLGLDRLLKFPHFVAELGDLLAVVSQFLRCLRVLHRNHSSLGSGRFVPFRGAARFAFTALPPSI